MSVLGNLRIQNQINLGYPTDPIGQQASVFFNGLASDNTTPLSTELKLISTIGPEQGYLEIPTGGLIVDGTDVIEQINLVTSKIFDTADNETKIETKDNEIVMSSGLTSVSQNIINVSDPNIRVYDNLGRIETLFNTDVTISSGNNLSINGLLTLSNGLSVTNGGIDVVGGDVTVADNTILAGDLGITGQANLESSLTVSGGIIANGIGIQVTGASVFNDDTDFKSNLNLEGDLEVTGQTTFNDTVDITSGEFKTSNGVATTSDGLLTANDGLTITSGNLDVLSGNLTVMGNLTVSGTTSTVTTTNLNITDNIILLNKDEIGFGITSGSAGFEIERGSLSNVFILFDEASENLQFGQNGNLKDIALRDVDANMIDGGIHQWNGLNKCFEQCLTEDETKQLKNIDSTVVPIANWQYLGNMNQNVASTSDVVFNDVGINGELTLGGIGQIVRTPFIYDFGNNNQTDINNTVNTNYETIFVKNLIATGAVKTGFLTTPSLAGISRNFIFTEKHASATPTTNYVQIVISASDFTPPYEPPTTISPTQYTLEMRSTGQTINLITDGVKWFLKNPCNCILTDDGT